MSKRLTRGAPLAAIVLVGLALGVFILFRLLFILELIAIGALLALVIRVIIDGLRRLGFPTWLAVSTMLAGVAAFGAFVWFVLIPNILDELQALIPQGPGSLQQKLDILLSRAQDLLNSLPFIPDDFLTDLPQRLQTYLAGLLGTVPGALPTFASIFSTALVGVIAVIFLGIYFAISPNTYIAGIVRLAPADRREGVRVFFDRLGRRLRGWIVGTVIVSIFVGIGVGVGLWLIGVPLPLTFALLAAVLNVIPFLGAALAGVLPGLVALAISPTKAILVGVLFIIIDQLDGNVLRPLVFSREVEISPGWVLVSILVLGVLLGPILGTFLAIPTAVVIGVVIDALTDKDPAPEDGEVEEKPSGSPSKQG